MALKDWLTGTRTPAKPTDWRDSYETPVKPAQDVVPVRSRPLEGFEQPEPRSRDLKPYRGRQREVTGPPGSRQQTATPSAFAMRIGAKCQHTRYCLSLVCDVLPDQSPKVMKAERLRGAADDGSGKVVYDGPLSMSPDFRCPGCDAASIVKCGSCLAFACHDPNLRRLVCPSCGVEAETVVMTEFKVEVGPERAGAGQPMLPGAEQKRITNEWRHVVVYNPANKLF